MLNKWFKRKTTETEETKVEESKVEENVVEEAEESKVEEVESVKPVSEPQNTQKLVPQSRKNQALKTVNNYVLISGGVGFIPLPLFDQVAIAGILGKMLHDLCKIYHVKLSEHAIKAIVASVLGGAHSDWITYPVTQSLVRLAPGLNLVGSLLARPLVSGAITYTIGRLFIHHFESGAWR